MHLAILPIEEAVGHILRHNIADERGRKALHKGHKLTVADLALLHQLGLERIPVAVFEPGDIHENEAARRVAEAVAGEHVSANPPVASRVNLLANTDGVVEIDVAGLQQLNSIDGITIATCASHSLVHARQRIATIKIIPFAVPGSALDAVAAIHTQHGPLISIRPLQPHAVGIVLVGSTAARNRIEQGLYPAIANRVSELHSQVCGTWYVVSNEDAIAKAITAALAAGATLIIIAGETSIMDRDDVTPQGIRLAGGVVEHYGAPVEPGNLLLLAYLTHGDRTIPLLGAPGCVRSRDTNIVDLLLPRLLAGEHVSRAAIIALGHGGLLK